MRYLSLIPFALLVPSLGCEWVPAAHGEPPIVLDLDTAEPEERRSRIEPWPLQTRVDQASGRFELLWNTEDTQKGRESIPLEAVEQVELARAFGNHPDELYVHLVNSRRILIARGEPVAMHAAVLSTWLEKPVVNLPTGEGHMDHQVPSQFPEPILIVNSAGTDLNIQPIEEETTVDETTNEDLFSQIQSKMTYFRSCYQSQLAEHPDLSGQVTMAITIDGSGKVTGAQPIKNSLNHPVVERCIVDELMRMNVTPPHRGEVTLEYPFSFSRS